MLDLIRKYGLTVVVLILVAVTSHAFRSLHLNLIHNVIYLLLLLLFSVSYYRACVVEPGYIYANDEESRNHEWERKTDGSRRFCRKCRLYKPGEATSNTIALGSPEISQIALIIAHLATDACTRWITTVHGVSGVQRRQAGNR